jgi:cyclophilin family peptidyl-prolyl cis-trans isomerase
MEANQMRRKLSLGVGLCAIAALLFCGGCGKSGTDSGQTATNEAKESGPEAKAAPVKEIPEVVMDTDYGKITIRLNKEKAPKTVKNFLAYVNSHFYDGTVFHQVFKNQGIIGGAYDENLAGKTPGSKILNEAQNGLKNVRYTISMLRDQNEIDSATSVFLINVVDNPSLDFVDRDVEKPENYGYCVFGEVIDGKEVIDSIASVDVNDTDDLPSTPVKKVVVRSVKRIK